jgi:hypothetical protein
VSTVINIILTHQRRERVAQLFDWWSEFVDPDNIVFAHGGDPSDFAAVECSTKVFVDDPRLRTSDHQREFQSYQGVFSTAAEWLRGRSFSHVYFAEYDHLPIIENLNTKQIELLDSEACDVLGHEALRIDGTNHPHYLYHLSNPCFTRFWRDLSVRRDASPVLSMLGTGSFWKREAFEAVANTIEPFPIYLELFLPTVAHHLGFRVREYPIQNSYVRSIGDFSARIAEARKAGAWTVHPVKTPPDSTANISLSGGATMKCNLPSYVGQKRLTLTL